MAISKKAISQHHRMAMGDLSVGFKKGGHVKPVEKKAAGGSLGIAPEGEYDESSSKKALNKKTSDRSAESYPQPPTDTPYKKITRGEFKKGGKTKKKR